jgi:hypothetical protein
MVAADIMVGVAASGGEAAASMAVEAMVADTDVADVRRPVTARTARAGASRTTRTRPWLIGPALAGVLSATAWARSVDPDWKFYGGVSSSNGQSWCFYDANSVVRTTAGHVTLAAKCLPQSDMDGVNIETDFAGEIARSVARERRAHYLPPYAKAETMETGQAGDIARLEQIADVANIAPRVKISYELDCAKSLTRELSLYVQVNGSVRSVDQPTEWKAISPEANTVRLSGILCRTGVKHPPRGVAPE